MPHFGAKNMVAPHYGANKENTLHLGSIYWWIGMACMLLPDKAV